MYEILHCRCLPLEGSYVLSKDHLCSEAEKAELITPPPVPVSLCLHLSFSLSLSLSRSLCLCRSVFFRLSLFSPAAVVPGDEAVLLTPGRMSQRQGKEREKEKEAGLQTPSRELLASPSSLSPGVSYSHGKTIPRSSPLTHLLPDQLPSHTSSQISSPHTSSQISSPHTAPPRSASV